MTYEYHSFQGYRVSFHRGQHRFTRYFSEKQYGSRENALFHARQLRDKILYELNVEALPPSVVFEKFRKKNPKDSYPTGLKAPSTKQSPLTREPKEVVTMRCSPGMYNIINQIAENLQVDHTTILRLAIYALPQILEYPPQHVAHLSAAEHAAHLHAIIENLESNRPKNFPLWEDFIKPAKKKNSTVNDTISKA